MAESGPLSASDDFAALLLRFAAARSLQQIAACFREDEAMGRPRAPSWPTIRVALTGNYSTQFLARGLPLALAARHFGAEVYESPYNQWRPELLDAASPLHAFAPSHIIIALTSIELAYGGLREPEALVGVVKAAVEAALAASEAQIILSLPEPLADEVSDICPAYAWRKAVERGLREALNSPRVTLVDIEPLIRAAGASAWYDDRFYDTSKLPFHPDRTGALLGLLADAVAATVTPRCKLIIVDLDDTLWGGRVGDDGFDGIDLDASGKGRHFLRLQAFLAGLRAQGIVLAIASKNDPANVAEVFDKRPEMMLRRDDFAAAEIHWEPKSTSVRRILDRLNLSTAGVVFLDDNPAERDEVRRSFPDLEVPELPEDPAQRTAMLARSGLFDQRVVTRESLARNRMYAENASRESAEREAGNYDDFLRDLGMVMEVIPLDAARERVIDLIHKTNQFNLTTRRYGWAELRAVERDGFGFCYRLKDKFGDNGIISIVVVAIDAARDARIDLWLMSCRVLGRKVEAAILSDVAVRARALGATRIVGEYVPTAKNGLVRDLYPRLGFTEIANDASRTLYALALDGAPVNDAEEFIRIVEIAATASA